MTDRILVNFLKFGLFFCLFIPVIIPSNLWYPFIFGKTIIFEITIEILFLAYLILLLVNPDFRPRKSFLFYGLSIFIFILILSTIFSVNPYRSFWGSMARMDGLFSFLHFFAFFILCSAVFKTKKDWQRILIFSCFVSFLIALGNLRNLGFSFAFLEKLLSGEIFNTSFGNYGYITFYLLFHIFLAIFLLNWKPGWFSRVFLGLVLVLDTLILISTPLTAGVLGLIAGFLAFISWLILKSPQKKFKIGVSIFLLILLIPLGFLFIFREKPLIKEKPYLSELSNLISVRLSQGRALAWQIAIKGILKKPILGWGLENYSIPFNLYYNPKYLQFSSGETWWDKPHNMVLEIGVSAGFLGLVSYLALFSLVFVCGQRIFREKKINFWGQAAIYGLFSAYFTQIFFHFDIFATYLIFFFLLAFLSQMSVSGEIEEKVEIEKSHSLSERKPILSTILAIFLICFFFTFSYFCHKNAILAASLAAKADGYLSGGSYSLARDNFKKALAIPSFGQKEIRIELAKLVINPAGAPVSTENISKEQILTDLEFVASELEKSRKAWPLEVDDRILLGSAYSKMAKLEKNEALGKAEEVLEEALKINPKRQEIYYVLSQVKGQQGKEEEMISLLEKTVSLSPEYYYSHWLLGWGYLTIGEKEKGLSEIEKAQSLGYQLDYGPNGLKFVLTLINTYTEVEDYQKIASLYEELIKRYSNPQFFASLAATYAKLGDKEKAKFYVKEAVKLDPSLEKEAERFLKTLE
jgi:putative inorganic carbon (HCO3(-)) transporter